ncbi:hypothetical protein ACJX0J_014954 [Zea mays]
MTYQEQQAFSSSILSSNAYALKAKVAVFTRQQAKHKIERWSYRGNSSDSFSVLPYENVFLAIYRMYYSLTTNSGLFVIYFYLPTNQIFFETRIRGIYNEGCLSCIHFNRERAIYI